jgi:hypothetical protein
MQDLKITILAVFCLISLQTLGQGVPKAYEEINYQGKVNGRAAKFILASGYIGASSIKIYLPGQNKRLVFYPESGVADVQDRLKFITAGRGNAGYFILDNMQEANEGTPAFIQGSYFLDGKTFPFKLILVRSSKHFGYK